jgi:predicted alpha/beta superfamily hydrolase
MDPFFNDYFGFLFVYDIILLKGAKKMGKIERFKIEIFDELRTIRIYLPKDLTKLYPVLFMHDGHNLFDIEDSYGKALWNIQETMDLIEKKYQKNLIVVGIDCHPKKRFSEYSPWRKEKNALVKDDLGGMGEQYLKWIVTTLKPLIDQRYPTIPEETYMAGSSMGGVISMYAGYRFPQTFKAIGCFSSAFWFARDEVFSYVKTNHVPHLRVYLDVGKKETDSLIYRLRYLNDTKQMGKLLRKLGTTDLKVIIDKQGIHHETAWAKRFPLFLKWLLEIE